MVVTEWGSSFLANHKHGVVRLFTIVGSMADSFEMLSAPTEQRLLKRIRELVIQDARENYDVDLSQGGAYFAGLPVRVVMRFYRRLPNTAFVNEKRTNRLKQEWRNYIIGTPDIKRPDLDNMCKLIIDALQGIVYDDDMFVVKIVAIKCYDYEFPYEGKTEVDVKYVNDDDMYRIEQGDE